MTLLTVLLASDQVALRVLFPDRYILQGFFRPSETGKYLQWPGEGHCALLGCSRPEDYSSDFGTPGRWGSCRLQCFPYDMQMNLRLQPLKRAGVDLGGLF